MMFWKTQSYTYWFRTIEALWASQKYEQAHRIIVKRNLSNQEIVHLFYLVVVFSSSNSPTKYPVLQPALPWGLRNNCMHNLSLSWIRIYRFPLFRTETFALSKRRFPFRMELEGFEQAGLGRVVSTVFELQFHPILRIIAPFRKIYDELKEKQAAEEQRTRLLDELYCTERLGQKRVI